MTARYLKFKPQDGAAVLARGRLDVYDARGEVQLVVEALEPQGHGALQFAFEQLKLKLAAEGLFQAARKRPLPALPERIGIVSSPSGAVIRDILQILERRCPGRHIRLYPAQVQGEGAAEQIAAGIGYFSTSGWAEVVIIARGGGSLEDLWAFNEEVVARAIFESALPVVSAVGHEIDFTISDFVADVRAATPSAAAEIITEGVFASREFVAEAPGVLRRIIRQRLEGVTGDFEQLQGRLTRAHPQRRLDEYSQRLDDLQTGLLRCAKQGTKERQVDWQNLATRLMRVRPAQLLQQRRELLKAGRQRLNELAQGHLRNWQNRFGATEARLRLLGPEQVLSRGYSITTDAATGKVLREAARIKAGERLKTRLKTGEIFSRAEE